MFVNVPMGLVSCFLAPILIRSDNQGKQVGKLDLLGSATATIGLTALVWVISEGKVTGWLSMPTVLVGALSIALLVAFVAIEKRTSQPMLRLDLFRDRSLLGANLAMLLWNAGMVACVFTLSFFLQRNLSLSSVTSGLAFIPISVTLIFATSLSSRLASRVGVRFLVACTSIAMAAGFLLYSRMGNTDQFIIPFLSGSVLVGLVGLGIPTLFALGVAGVPQAHRGAASGLLITSQQIGAALGVAIVTIVESAANNSLVRGGGAHGAVAAVGMQHGFIACSIFLVIGASIAISLFRRESRLTRAVS
jgi:predicted MFS family arabinose efflux permease